MEAALTKCKIPWCRNPANTAAGSVLCDGCREQLVGDQPRKVAKGPMDRPPIVGVTPPEILEARRQSALKERVAKTAEAIRARRDRVKEAESVEAATTPPAEKRKHTRWVITPEMDRLIRDAYENHVGKTRQSVTADLARKLGIPRERLTHYAARQGLIAKIRKKEPDWSLREVEIVWSHAHLSPDRLKVLLAREGFQRSITGIMLKRKRLGGAALVDGYSCQKLARCLGIDSHAVTRWIEAGHLSAEHRGTARKAAQGGDMWFIATESVRKFVREHVDLVDFRKLDKHWLVSLL